jgi:5'(3')-deoxyribonucleotidase
VERKKLLIAVDVDGVLADFTYSARQMAKGLFGKPADDVVQTEWGFTSVGLTETEESILWKNIHQTPNFWYGLRRLPNTSLLPELVERHDVVFITNRMETGGDTACDQTTKWLINNFRILRPRVILASEKGPVIHRLGVDVFIDDKPSNLRQVREVSWSVAAGKYIELWLKTAEYNKESTNHGFNIADSFNEFALAQLRKEL